MRIEEIALRQEARQMLCEAGLNKEELKELVLKDIDDKVIQAIESKIKGNFRLKGIRSTNPVAVGDYG